MSGWIKIYRGLQDSAIASHPEYLAVWVHLLLRAQYSASECVIGRQIVRLTVGQLVFGRIKFSSEIGVSENKVRAALDVMKSLNMITIKSMAKFSIISITNWQKYQEDNQQITDKPPADSQHFTSTSPAPSHIQEGKEREESKEIKKLKTITPQAADHVLEIFEYWKTLLKHPKAKLDDKRKKLINNALKLGYEPHDLMDAIEGCSKSPYHMGCDGRNTTVYDDLDLILRDAKHIDQFLKVNLNPPAPSGVNYGSHQQPNRPSSQQHGLAHDDTKWADELFGAESPAVDRFDQQGIQVIEGDFSCVGGGDQRP